MRLDFTNCIFSPLPTKERIDAHPTKEQKRRRATKFPSVRGRWKQCRGGEATWWRQRWCSRVGRGVLAPSAGVHCQEAAARPRSINAARDASLPLVHRGRGGRAAGGGLENYMHTHHFLPYCSTLRLQIYFLPARAQAPYA